MKLILIHGAPAAGKLTTAKALLRAVPGRLFDNHAAIDVARTVFDFGAPGFWELVRTVRNSVLDAAAKGEVPRVVMTFVYVEPDDIAIFNAFETIVQNHGGEILPVYLKCSGAEIVRRIGNADRVARRKMTSEQGAKDFLVKHSAVPVPRGNCLTLDSSTGSADANAAEIVRHFGLAPSVDG
jgi:hypothetical protein